MLLRDRLRDTLRLDIPLVRLERLRLETLRLTVLSALRRNGFFEPFILNLLVKFSAKGLFAYIIGFALM